ncbi:lantibiotic dehydratase [Streptomyces sp. NPDC048442]|uniref:lantibiotic dehydratase n=1 Tax=Streptomyces sp. NPDC048442 TaxID=3154823 RepID=UPI003437AA3F
MTVQESRRTLFRGWDHFLLRAPLAGPRTEQLPPGEGRTGQLALLAALAADPLLCEAVALASPSLSRTIDLAGRGDTDRLSDAQVRRAALSALRYDIRMRTRPTPFGLFAGVAGGRFDTGAKTEDDARGPRHRTRVDMDWLFGLVQDLEALPGILTRLRVQAHTALVERGGRIRLDTPANPGVSAGQEARSSVSVRSTPAVREVLGAARELIPVPELAQHLLTAFPSASEESALRMVQGLVKQELLITSLRPPLDGEDPLDHVVDALRPPEGAPAPDVLPVLLRIAELRDAYDACPPGEGRQALAALTGAMRELRENETPLHLETSLGAHVTLPEQVRTEAERALDVMWRIAPDRLGMRPLRPYQRLFLEKYGVGRLVPILELLDETVGLGAPAGYTWPNAEAIEEPGDESRGPGHERVLARLAAEAVRDGRIEVVLDDKVLDELDPDPADPRTASTSCELYLQLATESAEDLCDGRFRLVLAPNPGSHRAGATLGRFADLLDPAVAEGVTERCGNIPPQVPGAIVADLAYVPRSARAGNIAHNRACTGRRIPVGLPVEGPDDIRLDDIAIGTTLDRMYAVHLPTGRELVAVAHNMLSPGTQAPNAARMLYEIGQEGHRLWEPWDWGPASAAPFLPRVRYGRVVLFPAVWKLDALRAHAETGGPKWAAAIDEWRRTWRVPLQILALSQDQRLLLDLTDPLHREILRDEVRKDDKLMAQEPPAHTLPRPDGTQPSDTLPGPASGDGPSPDAGPSSDDAQESDDTQASDGEHSPDDGSAPAWPFGRTVELVLPAQRDPDLPPTLPAGATQVLTAPGGGPRAVLPGGEWIYLKLYGAWRGQEALICEQLGPLVSTALEAGADRWFFIRYRDPDTHLRLRLHGDAATLWPKVLPALVPGLESLRAAGLIGRYVLDTFDPEWERYGGPAAQRACEEFLQADSVLCATLMDLARQPGAPYDLDTLATIAVAALAHSFGAPSPGTPWTHPRTEGDPAAAWLGATGDRKDVPPRYRAKRQYWRGLLDPYGGWPGLAADEAGRRVLAALALRDAAAARYGERVRELAAQGALPTPEFRIVGSLIHMTCNRLFGGTQEREDAALAVSRATVLDHLDRRRHTA